MINLEASILRVLNIHGQVVGAAFIVTAQLVITCAHVVQSAGYKPGKSINLKATDGNQYCAVPKYWRDADNEDIAILEIENPLSGYQTLKLGSSTGTRGHIFSTFGFPKSSQELYGSGEIVGAAVIKGIKLLQLRSPEVTAGFSGAPVFDEVTTRVVGVVTAIEPQDKHKRLETTAFAVLSETIQNVCPDLQISDISPYRSLRAFTEEDSKFFFGREQVIKKMLDRLREEPRFLAVLGPSGSGKSSVVQAGLIPVLKRGNIPGSDKWGIIFVRSTEDPTHQLANAGMHNLESGIKYSVSKWLEENPEKTRLVLIFDQFEEILLSTPENKSYDFIAELANLLAGSSLTRSRITLILILRDALYSRFMEIAGSFQNWFERSIVNIPSTIEVNELHSIIVEPAKEVGLAFQEGLVDTIIQDIVKIDRSDKVARSTILPLLEFALTQLWQKRSSGQLTYDCYRSINGVTGGLPQWANETYSDLEEMNQHLLCRRVLCDLVRLGNPDIGVPDTRRRVSVIDLAINFNELEEVQNVITTMTNARLLISEQDNQQHEMVELIHDSLITEWRLLQSWIYENRNFLIWKQRLSERLSDWKNNLGDLLHGRELKIAEDYLAIHKHELSKEIVSFIDESEKARIKNELDERRQLKIFLAIEGATATIKTLEAEGRASIENVLASLLPNLVEALDAAQAFAAIHRVSKGNHSKGFDLVSIYPQREITRPFLPATETMLQVLSNDRAHVIEPFVDEPRKFIHGLEIFNATTAVLVPLRIEYQAWVVGVCNRRDPEMGPFLAADRSALESIIKLIAIGFRVGERRSQLKTTKEIAETIGLGLDLESTMDAVLKTLHDIFERTRLRVLLYQSDIQALKFAPATLKYHKIQNPKYQKQDTFPLDGRSIACRVARKALLTGSVACENVGNVINDPDYLPLNSKIQSQLCVSLMGTRNNLLGVLVLERDDVDDFDEADEDLVKTVGQQLSIAIERAQRTEELEFRTTVAAQTAWAADMAYEINNEVGQIRNWAYMLRDRLKDDPELQEFARKIEESASVLSSTGPWSDRPPQIVKLDLFLDRNLKNLTSQRNLNLELNLDTPDIYIRVNPTQFQRVLRHLVQNAARAMSNSRIPKLKVNTRSFSSIVEILFQDTGPGISKEVQLSIFQRPITTKDRGGYGLLLVRQMIEDMHGQIKLVAQKRGQGATFSIQFPIASRMNGEVE